MLRPIGANSIELLWRPSVRALRYRVLWDAGTGTGLPMLRAVVVEPRFVERGLLPGVYAYWVLAEGAGGVSSPVGIDVHVPVPLVTVVPFTPRPLPTATATVPAPLFLTPTPTWRPTATSIPAPTPPDTSMVVMGLLSHRDFIDPLGDMHVVGEVRNETEDNLDNVLVRVMFYNRWGGIMRTITAPALGDVVAPKEQVPFALSFPEPRGWDRYTIRVTARPTMRQPSAYLSVVEYHTYGLDTGILHVVGRVVNRGERSIPAARVVVTLYDPWGNVVNAGFAYTEHIPPGGEAEFDCSFTTYELVDSVAVRVEPG